MPNSKMFLVIIVIIVSVLTTIVIAVYRPGATVPESSAALTPAPSWTPTPEPAYGMAGWCISKEEAPKIMEAFLRKLLVAPATTVFEGWLVEAYAEFWVGTVWVNTVNKREKVKLIIGRIPSAEDTWKVYHFELLIS